jgi:hypothetical protein
MQSSELEPVIFVAHTTTHVTIKFERKVLVTHQAMSI